MLAVSPQYLEGSQLTFRSFSAYRLTRFPAFVDAVHPALAPPYHVRLPSSEPSGIPSFLLQAYQQAVPSQGNQENPL